MIDHAGEVLILTGPPGAGKTTTAGTLAALPGAPKVHLHADDFWHVIKAGAIPPYEAAAHRQNAVVIDALAGAAATYARGGYFVVLDGIVGPWFLAPFRALAVPVHYVVLRPPLDIAISRCQARGGDTLTAPEPITALHRQFAALDELETHAIATEGQSPADTVQAVIAALAGGRFRLPA